MKSTTKGNSSGYSIEAESCEKSCCLTVKFHKLNKTPLIMADLDALFRAAKRVLISQNNLKSEEARSRH